MDTGTHIVMGIALGGLALADPVVASSTLTTTAVIAGTIIGSQAPDIDTVLKLRNNAVYIRHHRGITHSIPAVILWPILISGCIMAYHARSKLIAFMVMDIFSCVFTCVCGYFQCLWNTSITTIFKKMGCA